MNIYDLKIDKINTTIKRIDKYYKSEIKNKNINLENGDKYYFNEILNNYFLGNIKDNNSTNILKVLRSSINYNDIIISYNLKELGILNIDDIENYKNSCCYEVLCNNIYENSYFKLYLDCEICIKIDRWIENHKYKIKKLLYKNICDVIEILKDKFNYNVNKNQIFVSDASGNDDDKEIYKCSYHISLPIYVSKLEYLYDIFSYLNNNIFSLKSNSFKDENIMDINVYVKNPSASRKWRMLYNTKNGKRPLIPIKLEDLGYSENIRDHLCLSYILDLYNAKIDIFDISKVQKLNYTNISKKGYSKEIYGDDYVDIYNLNIKPSKQFKKLTYEEVLKLYRANKNEIEIYLLSIENNKNNRLSFKIWFKIGKCLKFIGFKYNNDINFYLKIFLNWTDNSYDRQNEKHRNNALKLWNKKMNIEDDDNNIGIPFLKGIAFSYDNELYMKILYSKTYNYIYDVDINDFGYDEYIYKKDEPFKIKDKWINQYKTILINSYYGEGKTKEALRIQLENYEYIIIISNRRIYAIDIVSKINKNKENNQGIFNNTKPIINYLNDDLKTIKTFKNIYVNGKSKCVVDDGNNNYQDIDLDNLGGIAISLESLIKFNSFIDNNILSKNKKVMLFIDESESLFINLLGDTNNNKLECLKLFSKIWKKVNLRCGCDGQMTIRSHILFKIINYLSNCKDKMLYANTNRRNLYPKTYYERLISNNKNEKKYLDEILCNDIIENLINGEKVMAFIEYAKNIELIQQSLINYGMNDNDILAITSKIKQDLTDEDEEKLLYYLKNPNELYQKSLWVYNACILNGVSVEIPHFTLGFIHIGYFGISSNDANNAIMRPRHLSKYYLYGEKCSNKKLQLKTYPLDLNKISNLNDNKKIAICNSERKIENLDKEWENINDFKNANNSNNLKYDKLDNVLFIKNEEYINQYDEIEYYLSLVEQNKAIKTNSLLDITFKTIEKMKKDIIIAKFSKEDLNDYYKYNLIQHNKFIKALDELNIVNDFYNNFNRIFKYESFKQNLKDYNNIIIENDLNIALEEYDDDNDNDDEKLSKSRDKIILEYLDKQKEFININYGIFKVKSIEQTIKENRNETAIIGINKILNHFNNDNVELNHNNIWALYDKDNMFKSIIETLILIKQKKRSKNINTDNIIKLIKIFKTDIYNLPSFQITNKYIKDNNLYNEIHSIANENRADNKLLLKVENKQRDTIMFINDANEILSIIGLKLNIDKSLTKKITLHDKSRFLMNTYKIESKYSKDFKYNDIELFNISSLSLIKALNRKIEFIDNE